jgi:hypothetical protein
MKKRIHHNSIEAFDAIEDERSERAELIYRRLLNAPRPMTDRELMAALGFQDPNAVRPRITELIDNRWLVETGSVECPVTSKRVRRVRALNSDERADLIARQRARWEAQRPRIQVQPELQLSFA